MFKDNVRFLGLCILISSIIISVSLIINGFSDRYFYTSQSGMPMVFDKLTGKAFVTLTKDGISVTTALDMIKEKK